jgi:hypothetical protein
MAFTPCPECGQSAPPETAACPRCGRALANDVAPPPKQPIEKPVPPAEVSNWVLDRTPPEMIEEARRTFNEQDFLSEVREIERTGGVKFEDFIGEIEEIVKRRD